MPKIKRELKPKKSSPLDRQLAYDETPYFDKKTKKNLNRQKKNMQTTAEEDEEEDDIMPEKLTQKTLALAREQQEEEEKLDRQMSNNSSQQLRMNSFAAGSDSDDISDEEMNEAEEDDLVRFNDGYVEDTVEMCEDDEEALANFMLGGMEKRNLADIIMNKIREKESQGHDNEQLYQEEGQGFDPKIVEVYNGVGKILKRYTSGKLPKAFKVIPSLSYWEDILWLTQPEDWSPHAMRAATRLFASNLNPKMAQRFYNIFLLEHVRQDIRDNKKLNFHLYMALKKALYKPQAFFKGIILPLCESNNCSLREAAIIGSALSKVTVPVVHSAAALMKIAEMPYSGANSMFIQILLNKKYSLPTRVISHLAAHFMRFTSDNRTLPVLWHQALLVFAQRYKDNISKQDKEGLKGLFKVHFHHQITPEIRRELYND